MQTRLPPLGIPFFLSGVAALIYQVCWQRLLFVAFGVDMESITVIVSTFMLGLGVGALVGGALADRYPDRIIGIFGAAEFLIGLFGVASPWLIGSVAQATIQKSLPITAVSNFLLLLPSTALMGATLPMLVALRVNVYGNVGVSIGGLYFVNTLGATVGAFATGFVLLYYVDLNSAIYAAAAINFLVSALIVSWFRRGS
jgi:MFS family permease